MERRQFLRWIGKAGLVALRPTLAYAGNSSIRHDRLLVLVELKGGNDGLNTLVPYADPEYYALRPRIAIKRDDVVQLTERAGLHPALEPLLPLWRSRELALLQGVGYPAPNLSHFRSIEIWDTASRSDQYLSEGWLARAFQKAPAPSSFTADGVVVGSPDMGPLSGGGARTIALSNPAQFVQQARLAGEPDRVDPPRNPALAHLMKVESDVGDAARKLGHGPAFAFRVEFPKGAFGETIRTASQVVAGGQVAALRLTLAGFDTHNNQPATQANLLNQLAEGLAAFRAAMLELGRWNDTLMFTYGEFGRRPKENQSNGTDHGTASTHFVLGGAVKGGLYGTAPDLGRLDSSGNMGFAIDFRSLYALVLDRWWQEDSVDILGGRFPPLDLLQSG